MHLQRIKKNTSIEITLYFNQFFSFAVAVFNQKGNNLEEKNRPQV